MNMAGLKLACHFQNASPPSSTTNRWSATVSKASLQSQAAHRAEPGVAQRFTGTERDAPEAAPSYMQQIVIGSVAVAVPIGNPPDSGHMAFIGVGVMVSLA